MAKLKIVLRDRQEERREQEALAALERFRQAEMALDAAWAEHEAAADELAEKLKATGWPVTTCCAHR